MLNWREVIKSMDEKRKSKYSLIQKNTLYDTKITLFPQKGDPFLIKPLSQ